MARGASRKRWKQKRHSARRGRRTLNRRRLNRGQCSAPCRIPRGGLTGFERSKVAIPTVVSLLTSDLHDELTVAMATLRRAFAQQASVCLDFSATRMLYPEGMLLVWAELTRALEAFPNVEVSCVPARNKKVSHVLQHLGIYATCNYTAPFEPEGDDVLPWQKVRGKRVDVQEAGKIIEDDRNFSEDEASFLYEAVSEAVTNVSQHAVLGLRKDGLNLDPCREWWMLHKRDQGRLFIAVCDLGIGIPASLPIVHTMERVREVLARMFPGRRPTDGRMIKAALRIGRTRTGETYRGLGFSDILEIIDNISGSALNIFSNRGRLSYHSSATSRRPSIKIRTFKNSVLGTILVWSFPLRDATS